MKKLLSVVVMILSILCGLYVGGWVMFILPILEACKMFDAGTLTGYVVGMTVLKCIFASCVGSLIIWLGGVISQLLLFSDAKSRRNRFTRR